MINENLHVWESEGEGLGFRTSKKNSTSNALSQAGTFSCETDHPEENLEFPTIIGSVSTWLLARTCISHPPLPLVGLLGGARGTRAHLSSPSWHYSS